MTTCDAWVQTSAQTMRRPGNTSLQHRAVCGHLAQIQHRRVLDPHRRPAIGLVVGHQHPVRQHGQPIHQAADHRPGRPCRSAEPRPGCPVRTAAPVPCGPGSPGSRQPVCPASPAASPCPGRSSQTARRGSAIRDRQIGQVLQQGVDQLAAAEAVACGFARRERRWRLPAPAQARRSPAGWAPAVPGWPASAGGGKARQSGERPAQARQPGDPWLGALRRSAIRVPRAAAWRGAADRRPRRRTPRAPPAARQSRARPAGTSTRRPGLRLVCQPQTTSRSSARVSAT